MTAKVIKADINGHTCDYFNDDETCQDNSGRFVKRFGRIGYHNFVDMDLALDGGFIFLGEQNITFGGQPQQHTDFWVVKTDEYGNVDCGTSNLNICESDIPTICSTCNVGTGLCENFPAGLGGSCDLPSGVTFDETYGKYGGKSARETSDGGYVTAGYDDTGCAIIKTNFQGTL